MDFMDEMMMLAAGRRVSLVFPVGVSGVVTAIGDGADVAAMALAAEDALCEIQFADESAIAGAVIPAGVTNVAAVKISLPFTG